jgi:hypothetical protein
MAELDPLPSYTVQVRRLDPTMAEVHVEFASLPADVEVRGRVAGPRCPGVSTIEVAYPLQPIQHPIYRVLVPEPVFWTAERPCVYEGPVEFRRGGQLVGKIMLSLGIKATKA